WLRLPTLENRKCTCNQGPGAVELGARSVNIQDNYRSSTGECDNGPQQISREQWRSICETSVRPEKSSVYRKLAHRSKERSIHSRMFLVAEALCRVASKGF